MTKQEEKALNELDYLNVLMYSVVKQTNVDRMDAVVWALERQSDILGSLLFPEKVRRREKSNQQGKNPILRRLQYEEQDGGFAQCAFYGA